MAPVGPRQRAERHPADHALRPGEDGRGAGGGARPQGKGFPDPPADPDGEHDPRASRRVRDRRGEGHPQRRPTAGSRRAATRSRPTFWPASFATCAPGSRRSRRVSKPRRSPTRWLGASPRSPGSGRSPPAPSLLPRQTSGRSGRPGIFLPGWALRRNRIRAAARSGSGGSPKPATGTCGACSTWAP